MKNNTYKLNPNFVTGFTDAEGPFCWKISIRKSQSCKTVWSVEPCFQIDLHAKDLHLLYKIQSFFGGIGRIYEASDKQSASFTVASIKDITNVIIPHFEKYPLLTQKRADFEFFKMIIELVSKKEHLNTEGLAKILSIRASMNWGLSQKLINSFPNIIPVERPFVEAPENFDPNWIVGFTEGEGNFYVSISKSKAYKSGSVIQLKFRITQHSNPPWG